jgi:hypothetical protein
VRGEIMEQRIITIYCLIEEFLKSVSTKKEHKLSEISDSEVLFLSFSLFFWKFINDNHLGSTQPLKATLKHLKFLSQCHLQFLLNFYPL